uniref:Uncharacterized protein LOC113795101 n=1 Tax=Dermatophagoides pteronyssinus TaxID=6956 RepID=A0A6P6Y6L1_DERPT|nr:uncharacterized protein LOC113795101 [Dermatophagoides pteronyssinus]
MTIFNFKSRKSSSSRNTDCPKNPKILLLGALPNSSKLNFFFAYENCRAIGQHRCGQQPAMGVQLNTIPYRHQNNHIFLDIWNFVINFERYDRLASIYWQNTEAIVGVCSLHSVGSFLKMKYWIEKFLSNNPDYQKPIYILAYAKTSKLYHRDISEQLLNDYVQKSLPTGTRSFIIHSGSTTKDLKPFFNLFLNRIVKSIDNQEQQRKQFKRLRLKQKLKTIFFLRRQRLLVSDEDFHCIG